MSKNMHAAVICVCAYVCVNVCILRLTIRKVSYS